MNIDRHNVVSALSEEERQMVEKVIGIAARVSYLLNTSDQEKFETVFQAAVRRALGSLPKETNVVITHDCFAVNDPSTLQKQIKEAFQGG